MPIDAPIDPFTGLSAARFGLYVHFPYCLARCPYCDFAIAVSKVVPEQRYADAVIAELDLRLSEWPELRGRRMDSIYFGGGTPSLWGAEHVKRVIDEVRARFDLSPSAEISLEANPEIADAARYAGYREAGVNRLSLGVQSFDAGTLKALGRAHDAAQADAAVQKAREAGFDNVSLDLIYGAEAQTVDVVRRDAEHAVSLNPDHISAYALTVERDVLAVETVLARRLRKGELTLPEDDEAVAMVDAAVQTFERAGILRYEVSNFARPGKHSRHNALYWTGGEYLAVGVGAVGLIGNSRYTNLRGSEHYLSSVETKTRPDAQREELSREERFEERLAMGLRLANGIDLRAVCEAYGQPAEARLQRAEQFVRDGFAEWQGPRLRLTPKGMDVHSEIAARLI